jgi:hypothetical protein
MRNSDDLAEHLAEDFDSNKLVLVDYKGQSMKFVRHIAPVAT